MAKLALGDFLFVFSKAENKLGFTFGSTNNGVLI